MSGSPELLTLLAISAAGWRTIWTVTLALGIGMFAVMSIYVSVAGLADIRMMFRQLRAESEAARAKVSTPGDPHGSP